MHGHLLLLDRPDRGWSPPALYMSYIVLRGDDNIYHSSFIAVRLGGRSGSRLTLGRRYALW
jgi:hypothetical protein